MKYNKEDYGKIKLIIWDLDETFWNGTFSEGAVVCPPENIELLKYTSETGVVNSICSKNEKAPTIEKLRELGAAEYFVFPSINWEPKGARIRQLIEDMQLRAANVLFLDDNHLNLAEAEFYCPEIMAGGPELIPELLAEAKAVYDSGKRKSRIAQYRILEEKQCAKESFASNEDFLKASSIRVEISEDCADKAERIWDLNKRSNQLNFTKNKVELDEIKRVIENPRYRCGTVAVSDNFGDYGITGFYCVDSVSDSLVHFCFSCRTMGMGVEQYVYKYLNKPELTVVGEISSDVNNPADPYWINTNEETDIQRQNFATEKKILFKGPCDLWSVCNFFADDAISEEFTYTIAKNGAIDYGLNHSVTMLNALNLSEAEKAELEQTLPFIGELTYSSEMYSNKYNAVLLSVLMDGLLACYRNRKTGVTIVWGDWNTDITNPENWKKLINGETETYGQTFTEKFLTEFAEEWEYLGRIPVEKTAVNFKEIRKKLPKDTVLVLLLGSEIAYEKNNLPAYDGMEEYNRKLNRMMEEAFSGEEKTYLLNTTKLITSQSDFNDRITHFRKPVYYRMAGEINSILAETNNAMHQKSKAYMLYASARQKLWQSEAVRNIYYKLRRKS